MRCSAPVFSLIGLLVVACTADNPAHRPSLDHGPPRDDLARQDRTRPADVGLADRRPGDVTIGDLSPTDRGPTPDSGPPRCTAPTNRALRIFFIGNSFTLGGPIPTLVDSLVRGAGFPDPDVQYSAYGGYTLEKHRSTATSTDGVDKGNWDFVVLQEHSIKPTDSIGNPAGFKKDASWFYDRVKAKSPAGQVVLYETWARHKDHSYYPKSFKDPADMQAQLRKHYNDAAQNYIPKNASAARKTDVRVAPAGDAWEKHLAGSNPLRLHGTDNYHAGTNGQYLNALVIFSTIYGCRASGLDKLSLSPADAARLQAAADATTGIKGVPPGPPPPTFPVGATVRVDLGSNRTTATGWNNVVSSRGSLSNLKSSSGAGTSADLVITDAFSGGNTAGRTDNTLGWPGTVSGDTLWAGSFNNHADAAKEPAEFELKDLPPGDYTVKIFASRAGKDGSRDRLGRYTIGSKHQDLDATDNRNKKLVFSNISVAKGGAINVRVVVSPAGTARFSYVGALELVRVK